MTTRYQDHPVRCPEYRCQAVSIDGLVQQVAVSYLRYGYFHYVANVAKAQTDTDWLDSQILTKYNIRKCWRFRAEQKARGFANLQYIRHGQFYVIMATEGQHRFKEREGKRLRDVRTTPLFVPIQMGPLWAGKRKKQKKHRDDPRIAEGYSISYQRGRYERKSSEERAQYRKDWEHWKSLRLQGKRLPKPPKGKVNLKWHPTVAIEEQSAKRLRDYFMTYATKWKTEKIAIELRSVPCQPYWAVKRELFSILCAINDARHTAGLEKVPYRVVQGIKRDQIFPFGEPDEGRASNAA